MAYLKRFSSLFAAIALLMSFQTASGQISPKTDTLELREASLGRMLSLATFKKSPRLVENYYASQLDTLGIKLRPGTSHRRDSKPTTAASRKCKSIVYQTLMKLPASHRNQLKELTLFYTEDGRRGLGGNGAIVLRCLNVTDSELASVLVHEVGHLVDGSFLNGTAGSAKSSFYDFDVPVKVDDPSSAFYRIAWLTESKKKTEASELDFCSLYGMSDPFEDFAECYAYYRLHGPEFRKLAKTSEKLNQKYEFMKSAVFSGKEFGELDEENIEVDLWERNYDVTVLPFPLKEFLS